MLVFVRLIAAGALAVAALLALFGPDAGAQGGDTDLAGQEEAETWITNCSEVAGVCVHAAERTSMRPVQRPGTWRPPTVVCIWYRYGRQSGGWGDPDAAAPVAYLHDGGLYVLDCNRAADGSRVTGYPRVVRYTPGERLPGEAVSGWEVAEYAVGELGLEPPVAAVAPPRFQVVGTQTWFAVTSRLRGYPERSAQAGSVWATVRADFADVIWDFGSRGRLRCTADAGRAWNPALPGDRQHSACTKVFETRSHPGLEATVTVTWRIHWRSSDSPGWRRHDDYSLSTKVPLDIRELQAVIR